MTSSDNRETKQVQINQYRNKTQEDNQFKIYKNESSNISTLNNHGIRNYSKDKFITHTNTCILQKQNSYVNWGITKNQPQISRANFPYCMDDEEIEQPLTKIKTRLKITNRVRHLDKQNLNDINNRGFNVEKQDPPVNQYLSYDLSQQITEGLYDVKILAEEIKNIKKQKQADLLQKQKLKPSNKIRIKKETKIKGSWIKKAPSQKSYSYMGK